MAKKQPEVEIEFFPAKQLKASKKVKVSDEAKALIHELKTTAKEIDLAEKYIHASAKAYFKLVSIYRKKLYSSVSKDESGTIAKAAETVENFFSDVAEGRDIFNRAANDKFNVFISMWK